MKLVHQSVLSPAVQEFEFQSKFNNFAGELTNAYSLLIMSRTFCQYYEKVNKYVFTVVSEVIGTCCRTEDRYTHLSIDYVLFNYCQYYHYILLFTDSMSAQTL